MNKIKIKYIIIGKQFENNTNLEEFKNIVNSKKIKVLVVEEGNRIEIEKNVYFDVLWPDTNKKVDENSINNNALVCKLNYKKFSILFTGDIEEQAEKLLVNRYKSTNILKSNILKVGHHGSKTSSTQEFLNLVSPKIALIGVGKNNKFGHPNDEVVKRLENLNCKIYRTDINGEISIIVDTKGKVIINKRINIIA